MENYYTDKPTLNDQLIFENVLFCSVFVHKRSTQNKATNLVTNPIIVRCYYYFGRSPPLHGK